MGNTALFKGSLAQRTVMGPLHDQNGDATGSGDNFLETGWIGSNTGQIDVQQKKGNPTSNLSGGIEPGRGNLDFERLA